MIIAIDGPAASGKGTLAKRIAAHFGLPYLDTGLLYRAVARDVRARGGALDDPAAAAEAARILDPASLDDPNLRGYGIGDAASIVGRIPQVRTALLQFQQDFAAQPGGAVLDGRDIGTVVCPQADVKIFVTASPEIRAERRYLERKARGEPSSYQTVLDEIRRRDERDAGRSQAPMRAAADSFLLDTSNLDIEAAFNTAVGVISRKVGQRGRT
jgi:CMP/dCMP kinase